MATTEVDIKQLLAAGAHFGHKTERWHPKMAPYIHSKRNGTHIIDLTKTVDCLNDALSFLEKTASEGKQVLLVGTKRQAQDIVKKAAEETNMPYVTERWLGGMLTNFKTVKLSIKRLKELEQMAEDGSLERLSKKEALTHQRELEKLKKSIGGIKEMNGLPDAIFVIDVGYHKIAITEANKLGIPVVAVVDTNHSPAGVDYLIPGNDDSSRAIRLYARGAADAILEGKSQSLNEVVQAVTGDDEFVEVEEEGEA